MEQDIKDRFDALETKIDAIQKSTKKTQNYITITVWVTIIVFVLPIVGLLFAIPAMLDSMNQAMSILQY